MASFLSDALEAPSMAPLIPNAMRRPQAVWIVYAVIDPLAWRGEMREVKK
jgi:hypothetical protein